AMVAAVPRLEPHLLADRRAALPGGHRRGARAAEILGRAIHVGDRHPPGDEPDSGVHFLSRARKIFSSAGPLWGAQHTLVHPGVRPVEGSRVPHLFQRGPARGRRQRSAASEGGRLLRAGGARRAGKHPVERHRRRQQRASLFDRPLGRRHAHSGIHRIALSPPRDEAAGSLLMHETGWLWALFTIIAAAAQTARNAMQRELTGSLGTVGAPHVRFLFGFPFGLIFLIAIMLATGAALPHPSLAFWPWVIDGAGAQILATALMLKAMNDRSFVVTIAYIKT